MIHNAKKMAREKEKKNEGVVGGSKRTRKSERERCMQREGNENVYQTRKEQRRR